MVRGHVPSLLLNCGTLYLNILSRPRPCQLLKGHLKLTFFTAASLMTNDTLVCSVVVLIIIIYLIFIYCKSIEIFKCTLRTFLLLLLCLVTV